MRATAVCYHFRGGVLRRLTEDHTVVAELARRGQIAPEDVRHHPYRHVITNVLGGDHAGVWIDVRAELLESGDVVLLCTDGLTEMLEDDALPRY